MSQCVVQAPVPNDACYQQVIFDDSFCCDTEWDGICQQAYDDCIGFVPCNVIAPVPNDFCYDNVINNIPSCCDTEWSETCQQAYDDCNIGIGCAAWANVPQDACYYEVIDQFPDCCDINWDSNCNTAYYNCSGLESSCNSDVSICTPGVSQAFSFNQNAIGPPLDYADPVGCATGSGGNDVGFGFIILYITQTGPLNLLIDGSSDFGFIDVIVYNIPNGVSPCDAVMNPENEIGCNYAPASVGCTQFGTSFPCESSVDAPIVNAGQRIMVIVHDFSTSSETFTLELANVGAQTGPPDATITNVLNAPICNNSGSFQLNSISLGGTWSGNGVTPSGLFDPNIAGPGIHTINYSIGTVPCNDADQITVEVLDCTSIPCTVEISSNSPICVGDSLILSASAVENGIYTWSGPNFTSNLQNPQAIYPGDVAGAQNYYVNVLQDNNLSCNDTIIIEIKPLPIVQFDFKLTEINSDNIQVNFVNNTIHASFYIWDFDKENEFSEEFEPRVYYNTSVVTEFDVVLKAISDFGCIDSTARLIKHIKGNSYFIPNSFTPNGDEFNNEFKPIFTETSNLTSYKMSIYNKWGELIFETNDVEFGWDGTYHNSLVQNGTYTWFIEFKETKNQSDLKQFNGFVSVFR